MFLFSVPRWFFSIFFCPVFNDPKNCRIDLLAHFPWFFNFSTVLKFEAGWYQLWGLSGCGYCPYLSWCSCHPLCNTMDTRWQCGATFKLNAMNQNKIAFLLDLWDNNSKLAVKIKYNVFFISTYLRTKLSFVKCYQNNWIYLMMELILIDKSDCDISCVLCSAV